jgi:hypothetical protein
MIKWLVICDQSNEVKEEGGGGGRRKRISPLQSLLQSHDICSQLCGSKLVVTMVMMGVIVIRVTMVAVKTMVVVMMVVMVVLQMMEMEVKMAGMVAPAVAVFNCPFCIVFGLLPRFLLERN